MCNILAFSAGVAGVRGAPGAHTAAVLAWAMRGGGQVPPLLGALLLATLAGVRGTTVQEDSLSTMSYHTYFGLAPRTDLPVHHTDLPVDHTDLPVRGSHQQPPVITRGFLPQSEDYREDTFQDFLLPTQSSRHDLYQSNLIDNSESVKDSSLSSPSPPQHPVDGSLSDHVAPAETVPYVRKTLRPGVLTSLLDRLASALGKSQAGGWRRGGEQREQPQEWGQRRVAASLLRGAGVPAQVTILGRATLDTAASAKELLLRLLEWAAFVVCDLIFQVYWP